ncbi:MULTISPECIES: hypothetical protein [Kitasatospora]|uniref:SWIM-type domain-containing protein n=1 Tax=Kitasatospora setae (strain ATCC 33774 / DSM 43861 / JCM 3304 / KCC A-0304 / NBRC 14216 / KM-6054) TaxID=452652 RepID=E4N6E6_KITSK|nr:MULTISPECIES: hypothetical protein [Kitasatospora]BAJ26777.1 hypothetical protein KSE_09400 [Kitasatospora setae KM-6054]
MSAPRADLLALDADTLAALANRGLVKRAARELEAGTGPSTELGADGEVSAVFPDGSRAALPAGVPLDAGTCSCAAPGVCRHLVGLVLAYQARQDAPVDEPLPELPWSPTEFDDAALLTAFGRPALAAARRAWERGVRVTVQRVDAEHPAPSVELPSCTVRFPVPHSLNFALSGATSARHGELVALAVWAFRSADADGTPSGATRTAGGRAAATGPTAEPTAEPAATAPSSGDATAAPARTPRRTTADGTTSTTAKSGARTAAAPPALAAVTALAEELLRTGTSRSGPVLLAQLSRLERDLTSASAHWPAAAAAELRGQLEAYAARDTRHDPDRVAELLAELCARHRASDRALALGTGESAVTQLRRTRLVALGCRVSGRSAAEREVALYFAQPDAAIALVLRRSWTLAEGQDGTGAALAARRLLGHPVRALAGANLVSESVSRSAGRAVAIERGRIASTSVTPLGGAWASLPAPLLLRDAAARLRALGGRPPRLVRPRIEAENAHVLAIAEVGPLGYDPARQRLEAVLRDESGTAVLLSAEHDALCPGRVDALAAALESGAVSHVSGLLRQEAGRPVLDPLAVRGADRLVHPDLAAETDPRPFAVLPSAGGDPLTEALAAGRTALAELARTGLESALPHRLAPAAALLRRTGLRGAAALLDALAADPVPLRWADAAIHLLTALDLHQEEATGPGAPASSLPAAG